MTLQRLFGRRLRTIRREREITQEELAQKVGLSSSFISNLERGIDSPSFDTLSSLAKALEVHVMELFNFGENDE